MMQQLDSDLAEKKTLDAKAQSAVDSKKESLKAEQKKYKELMKNCEDVCLLFFAVKSILRF